MKLLFTASWRALLGAAFMRFLATAGTAFAAEPLVDVAWVKANMGKPGVVLVDIQQPANYQRGHIGSKSTFPI